MEARSPRLSDIAAKLPEHSAARHKPIQRFLQAHVPHDTLNMLFNEEADFVIGDPTEIERPHADKTAYVGTPMCAQTKDFYLLTLATTLRGRAIPFRFLPYSSHAFDERPSFPNCVIVGEVNRVMQSAKVDPGQLNLPTVPMIEESSR